MVDLVLHSLRDQTLIDAGYPRMPERFLSRIAHRDDKLGQSNEHSAG